MSTSATARRLSEAVRHATRSWIPIDKWKPTSEDFEGYTGNAGNTLDRWYHRSALVLWPRAHHFDVVASCGPAGGLPLFRAMVAKLARTPQKRFEAARTDCVRFARAIIARWPRSIVGYGYRPRSETSPQDDFPDLLLRLHDRETVARFLAKVAEQDQTLPLDAFVVAACREFGWDAFAQELKQLLTARPDDPAWLGPRGKQPIPLRELEWLAAFCLDKTEDPNRAALAHELCTLAAERFCEPPPPRPASYWPDFRRELSVWESSLPLLLKALVASGCDEDLARVLQFVERSPEEFRLEDCQVPALKALVPWAQKRFGSVPPRLLSWLASVRQKLQSATASRPAAPADWARPAEVACSCQYCAQLKAFLADPANEVGRIPAREDRRQHVIDTIRRHDCTSSTPWSARGAPMPWCSPRPPARSNGPPGGMKRTADC
jgi:hypothetical protein